MIVIGFVQFKVLYLTQVQKFTPNKQQDVVVENFLQKESTKTIMQKIYIF